MTLESQLNMTIRFNIKAVEREDKSLLGVVRMFGKYKSYRARGLCLRFEADEDRENLRVDRQNAFFYGNTEDLGYNYFRESPFSDQELKDFKDKSYSAKTNLSDRAGKPYIGFVLIPLEEMRITGPRRQSLIETIIHEAEKNLPQWIKNLTPIGVRTNEPNSMKGFGRSFASFPEDLKQRALETGLFYTLTAEKKDMVVKRIT